MVLYRFIFLLKYFDLSYQAGLAEVMSAPLYGLRLDVVVASYLTAMPWLALIIGFFLRENRFLYLFLKTYYITISVIITVIYIIDLVLFGYWNFRIDASVLLYAQQPKEAMASVNIFIIILYSFIFLFTNNILIATLARFNRKYFYPATQTRINIFESISLLLLGGLLFLGMRSSIQASTANIGMVYHSQNPYINQASINPAFNFLSTMLDENNLTKDTEFFEQAECQRWYRELNPIWTETDSTIQRPTFTINRPNIVLIILESFSANAIGCVGGQPSVTPWLDKLSTDGILFRRTYASSFRTDRGLAAALSGYPGQPSSSILKYPEKSRTLPSIASSLQRVGYQTNMLYGGDIDFTNMRSYFLSTGYSHITEMHDFPYSQRKGKWGVPDEYTFDFLARECHRLSQSFEPYLYTFLTLSSHEPFDVPNHDHDDPYLNSMAYTDRCIGQFINKMKQKPEIWNSTLFVFISDHGYPYPKDAMPETLKRYHIVQLWAGGVLTQPQVIDHIMSQSDLPATLLGTLDIPHRIFRFSKDIFDEGVPQYAFFSFPNLLGLVKPDGTTIYNFTQQTAVFNEGNAPEARINQGKAFLQTLMEDMQRRGKPNE